MAIYDNYVWRLQASSIGIDLQLPQDLEWVDEFSWNPIQQNIQVTLTGATVIQESKLKSGRPITLQGKDDMAWISRSTALTLEQLKTTAGLNMVLQYIEYVTAAYGNILREFNVLFRHSDPPVLELESVLRYDNFEPTTWYKVRNIKFIETVTTSASPCTANVTLTVTLNSGTFNIGEIVTGGTSGVSGTVFNWNDPTLDLYVENGQFQSGETITGPSGSATVN